VARALLDAGAISVRPDAPVTFRSGLRSPVYVDSRRLIFHPRAWRVVIESLAAEVRAMTPPVAVVAGVESAGIPHSSAVAFATGLPSVFVRKEARDHGLGRRIEGGDVGGLHTVLVEDMVTTGGSSLSAVTALRSAGATLGSCLAIITYGFPEALLAFTEVSVGLAALTTFETVIEESVSSGRLDERSAGMVRTWLADPHGWVP
jgi:orotate phosphoribosyltransferase